MPSLIYINTWDKLGLLRVDPSKFDQNNHDSQTMSICKEQNGFDLQHNNVENGVMDDDDNEESSVDEDGMNLMSPVSQALYQGYKKKVLKSNDICHREVQRGATNGTESSTTTFRNATGE